MFTKPRRCDAVKSSCLQASSICIYGNIFAICVCMFVCESLHAFVFIYVNAFVLFYDIISRIVV